MMRRFQGWPAFALVIVLATVGCEGKPGDGAAADADDPFVQAFGKTPPAHAAAATPASEPTSSIPAPRSAIAVAEPSVRPADVGAIRTAAAEIDTPQDSHVRPASQADEAHANRLARTNSPYLLLHAHNPVDWYPWGPEALERARRENKPIFLSIGYSSCYWCHVMERLVFSDVDIAAYMNQHFVCIKVDREERPDVDQVYMAGLLTYMQAIHSAQGGGWPMSLFLTPEGKPFLGGTYFPPQEKEGRPGFQQVCERVVTLWNEKPEVVEEFAGVIVGQMRRTLAPSLALTRIELDRELANGPAKSLLATFDETYGGFGFDAGQPDGPKFPVGSRLALLQYHVRRFGDEQAQQALRVTLDAMANGGLYDHLAGGFHRYSTDREWHVPHFEKMLYDQAQLASVYTEAYRHGHLPGDRAIAEGVLDFVLAELRAPGGAFHSSLDAETGGIEGAYYVWTSEQVRAVLGTEDADLFELAYGFDQPGDFEHGVVLRRSTPMAEIVRRTQLDATVVESRLAEMRTKLLSARAERERPKLDDKILTAWNGLMIRALADAGRVFGREDYMRAADEAAMFVLTNLRDEDGQLLRSYRKGEAGIPAYLDDHAFLVDGLLGLFEATRDEKWSNAARRLTDQQIAAFGDDQGGGFYYSNKGGEELVVPLKQAFDSALPAGNAVSVRNLIRIGSISGQPNYTARARDTLRAFAGDVQRGPTGTSTLALALSELLDDPNFGALRERPAGEPIAETSAEATSVAALDATAPTETRTAAVDSSAVDSPAVDPDAELDGPGEPAPAAPSARTPVEPSNIQLVGNEEPADPGTSRDEKKDEILEARAFLEYDKLPAGGKCRVLFLLKVREGWHVNANVPEVDYKIPTAISLTATNGTKLSGLVYPRGKPVRDEELEETTYEYANEVSVPGVLEIPAAAAGRTEEFELAIRYQACRDGRCLRPTTMTLKAKIAVAPAGTPLKSVNAKYFPETDRE